MRMAMQPRCNHLSTAQGGESASFERDGPGCWEAGAVWLVTMELSERGKEALAAFGRKTGSRRQQVARLSFLHLFHGTACCWRASCSLLPASSLASRSPLRRVSVCAKLPCKSIHRFPRAHVMTNQMDSTVQVPTWVSKAGGGGRRLEV